MPTEPIRVIEQVRQLRRQSQELRARSEQTIAETVATVRWVEERQRQRQALQAAPTTFAAFPERSNDEFGHEIVAETDVLIAEAARLRTQLQTAIARSKEIVERVREQRATERAAAKRVSPVAVTLLGVSSLL